MQSKEALGDFGEQVALNNATHVGHILRHETTTSAAFEVSTPDSDTTAWLPRTRTERKPHGVITAERRLINYIRERAQEKGLAYMSAP